MNTTVWRVRACVCVWRERVGVVERSVVYCLSEFRIVYDVNDMIL